ncbi:MAG TPA: YchJ family metal-binding protein [Kofleriaceae bacterium]|nr:YchJ family metal-binding protein [Kofleriaceae bacterium]
MELLGVDCPCGSGADEAACCGPVLAGTPAPTALALMRSRYTAYVRRAVPYLIATQDPATRSAIDRDALARWCRETTWRGLEIVATEAGGAEDDTGVVEFIARGVSHGTPFDQHERSRFRRAGGRWFYVDGDQLGAGAVRAASVVAAAKPGRNEPCPCGSGQKYKRCHGR